MANRSMLAKVERAKRQGREAAHMEFSKSCYAGWRDGVGISRAELSAMVGRYDGPVKVLAPGKAAGVDQPRKGNALPMVSCGVARVSGAAQRAGVRYTTGMGKVTLIRAR